MPAAETSLHLTTISQLSEDLAITCRLFPPSLRLPKALASNPLLYLLSYSSTEPLSPRHLFHPPLCSDITPKHRATSNISSLLAPTRSSRLVQCDKLMIPGHHHPSYLLIAPAPLSCFHGCLCGLLSHYQSVLSLRILAW